jgi:hypothetical protein
VVGLIIGLAVAVTATVAVILTQLDFWSYLVIALGTHIVLQWIRARLASISS